MRLVAVGAWAFGLVACDSRDIVGPQLFPEGDASTALVPAPTATTLPTTGVPPVGECAPDASQASGDAPAWRPPLGPATGDCTDAQVDIYVRCTVAFDEAACTEMKTRPMPECAACAWRDLNSSVSVGPIFSRDRRVAELNVAGCEALLTGDASKTSCAAKIASAANCSYAACAASCDPDEDDAALDACRAVAARTVCRARAEAADECARTECAERNDPADRVASVKWYLNLFCGTR